MSAEDDQQARVLATQLAMNQQSWAALREHGVTEDADLRLDFFYVAPDEPRAKRLAAFLNNETDYDVHVHSTKTGLLKPKS